MSKLHSLTILGTVVGLLGCLGLLGSAVWISRVDLPATKTTAASDTKVSKADAPACQVTVIAILVSPGDAKNVPDPRLSRIKNQLRKLIPANHAVKLLDVRTDRLSVDQAVKCELGNGRLARVTLVDPPDSEGKAKLRCELLKGESRLSVSDVATPLNQLFFCEHTLEDGSKFLIGIGAR